MKVFRQKLNTSQVLAITGGELRGEQGCELDNVCEATEANSQSIIFCEQERLVSIVKESAAGLIITNPAFADEFANRAILITEKPYFSVMRLISWWLASVAKKQGFSVHPAATVVDSASLPQQFSLGAHSIVHENVQIGECVKIGDNCSIAAGCVIGAGSVIHDNVCIYEDCVIGKNCIIHSGVVIGADGFGFLLMDGVQQKIPQVGNVIIHDDVEIGANSCIDRATLGSTIIGQGTKVDNLVQIGHNCIVGKHSILCALVGLAGSTNVGDYVYLAGLVGAAGHITIGDKAMVGAQSGISGDVPAAARYFGTPAIDANMMKRIIVAKKHLPDIFRHYKKQIKGEEND